MHPLHLRLSTALAATIAVALCALGLSAYVAANADAAGRYVALGDSNATGSGYGTTLPGSPTYCYRTDAGYPSLVAAQLQLTDFASAACSAAGTREFTQSQVLLPFGSAPPQFNALNGTETIVSLTIGDNNVDYGNVTKTCFQSNSLSPSQSATPCKDTYGADGSGFLSSVAAMGYELGVAIDQIYAKSPNATVFVVGYPRLTPPTGAGCWGNTNISPADAPVFDVWQRSIADAQRNAAAAHEAVFVDIFEASLGHDGCAAADRWSNPDKNQPNGWNNHPTYEGEVAMAQRLITAINTPRPPRGRTAIQSLKLSFSAKRVRTVTSRVAPITRTAPKKHGAKLSVTLARSGSVKFSIDRAKPGHIKNGKCRSLSKRASKGRKKCTRYVGLSSSVTLALPGGSSDLYFTGRAGGKQLSPGKYRLRASLGTLSAKTKTFKLSR